MNVSLSNHDYLNYPIYPKYPNCPNKADTSGQDAVPDRAFFAMKKDGFADEECVTCSNRTYQDKSDDSSVSFQSPTKMSPDQAAHMVRAHEAEHVRNEQQRAKENGAEVVAQSVQIFYANCGECGKSYVSGGETRTTTVTRSDNTAELFNVGAANPDREVGGVLDAVA